MPALHEPYRGKLANEVYEVEAVTTVNEASRPDLHILLHRGQPLILLSMKVEVIPHAKQLLTRSAIKDSSA